MDIKTRKQAMVDGENTYFTGKPCKNGHASYRYVQSGSCYECINSGRLLTNSPTAIARTARLMAVSEALRAKIAAVNDLIQIKVWIDDANVELYKATAHAYALMRHPAITLADVFPALPPTDRASSMACRRVSCHMADVQALREFADSLRAANMTQFAIDRERRLQKTLADIKIEPVPAWADRP